MTSIAERAALQAIQDFYDALTLVECEHLTNAYDCDRQPCLSERVAAVRAIKRATKVEP